MYKSIWQVILSGLWITVSEFARNEVLFKKLWEEQYTGLGLTFATLPVNGMLWMVWSMLLAFILVRLMLRISFWESFALAWLGSFAMMWVVVFNLQVLPLELLVYAIPLSILEILVAQLIIRVTGKAMDKRH